MLIYKKVLFSADKENLESRNESSQNSKEQFQNLEKQINELKNDISDDDKIDGVFESQEGLETQKILSESLKDALLNCSDEKFSQIRTSLEDQTIQGKEGVSQLIELVKEVERYRIEQQANTLYQGVLDVALNGDMDHIDDALKKTNKKQFESNLAKLLSFIGDDNYMESLYLGFKMNERKDERKGSKDDKKAFDDIMGKIRDTFKMKELDKESVGEKQLDMIFKDVTLAQLSGLVNNAFGDGWEGGDLPVKDFKSDAFGRKVLFGSKEFVQKFNLFGSKEFVQKFNEVNEHRIKDVKDAGDILVKGVDLTGLSCEEKDGSLVFKKGEKEISLVTVLGIDNNWGEIKGMDILNVTELNKSHFADVMKSWGENLKKRIDENKQSAEEESSKIWKKIPENLKGKNMNKDMVENIKSVVGDDKEFLKIEDNGEGKNELSCNLENAKKFLGGIKNDQLVKYWSLEKDNKGKYIVVSKPERRAVNSAVQLLLNDQNPNLNLTINGIWQHSAKNKRLNNFYNAIKDFQERNDSLSNSGRLDLQTLQALSQITITGKTPEGGGDVSNDNQSSEVQNQTSVGAPQQFSEVVAPIENLGKFSNGGFKFNEGVEKADENGKYIEIGGNKFIEYKDGMSGLGYNNGISKENVRYFYVGNWENGSEEGQGTLFWEVGDKYEGNWKNGLEEGQGTLTYASGNKFKGNWEDGLMKSGKFTIKSNDVEKIYDVVRESDFMKIIGPEGDVNLGKYINQNDDGKIVDSPSSS